MIKRALLNRENKVFKYYQFESFKDNLFDNISKINLFVGANNSGKSRLMRELFISLINNLDNTTFSSIDIKSLCKILDNEITKLVANYGGESTNAHLLALKERTKSLIVENPDDLNDAKLIEKLKNSLRNGLIKIEHLEGNSFGFKGFPNAPEEIRERAKQGERIAENLLRKIHLFPIRKEKNLFNCTFVPTSRTLRKFVNLKREENKKFSVNNTFFEGYEYIDAEILKDKIFQEYFLEKSREILKDKYKAIIPFGSVFTGEDLFERIFNLRNSTEEIRQRLTNFQNFLSVNFFENEKIEIHAIIDGGDKNLFIKIGEDKEFPLFQLGDGIQAIIILIFPIFESGESDHIIFYEEPELYLHPGMQRIFLETLKKLPKIQAFIATHSNHFLDLSIEPDNPVSIYSFHKEKRSDSNVFKIKNVSSPENNLLDLLGVSNSSVFLVNATIWVEGISERIFLRKYLEVYQKNYEKDLNNKYFWEDIHYSFIEYSGNNITHWSFLDDSNEIPNIKANAISNRIFLITDKDKGKELRHGILLKNLGGDNYYCLERREIENLVSPEVLCATLNHYKRSNIEKIQIEPFDYEEYKDVPMGEFIFKVVKNNQIKKIASVKDGRRTGKIKNKLDFAKTAVSYIESWNDLGEEAKTLTKKVYEFIRTSNS